MSTIESSVTTTKCVVNKGRRGKGPHESETDREGCPFD